MLWPFFPNWAQEYQETYSYLTEVIVSDDGSEQRRAWRIKARREIEYQAHGRGARFRALRRTFRNPTVLLDFPDEPKRVNTATTVLAGSNAVILSGATPTWMVPGIKAVLEDRQTRARELRIVSTVVGSTVTFAGTTARDWKAGTRIMPTLVGRHLPEATFSAVTDIDAIPGVRLMVEPGYEIEAPGVPVTTYRGLEVLTHRPNWRTALTVNSQDSQQFVDFEMGVRSPYRPIDYVTDIYQSEHMIRTPDQLDQVLGLFMRSQGRRGEFFAPTWLGDIEISATTASGSTLFTVDGHEFYDAYNQDPVYRNFCVRLKDNSLRFFRILTMIKSSSGNRRTFITTTAAADTTIAPSGVKAISWMPVCRFSSDDLVVNWTSDALSEIMLNLTTLKDYT